MRTISYKKQSIDFLLDTEQGPNTILWIQINLPKSLWNVFILLLSQHQFHTFYQLLLFILFYTIYQFPVFINFLLNLCEFPIMHTNHTHLSVHLYTPSALATSPTNENKTKIKIKKCKLKKTNQHFTMEAVVCHSMSHSVPFCPNSFICKCLLQWV